MRIREEWVKQVVESWNASEGVLWLIDALELVHVTAGKMYIHMCVVHRRSLKSDAIRVGICIGSGDSVRDVAAKVREPLSVLERRCADV